MSTQDIPLIPKVTERSRHWELDVLLDPVSHPVGTRMILTDQPSHSVHHHVIYEATILEWAPSATIVRLKNPHQLSRWVKCKNYVPIVIEVLETLGEEALAKLIADDKPHHQGVV